MAVRSRSCAARAIKPQRDVMRRDGVLAGKHVVVVGGGPGGCAAAAQAAKQGATVDVYDANPAEGTGGAQWIISLGPISSKALEALSLSSELGEHMRPSGMTIQGAGGVPTLYELGFKESPDETNIGKACLASRDTISSYMSSEVERVYGTSVQQHWSTRLVQADVHSGHLVFQPKEGAQFEVQADLIIGADGAGSFVRKQLQQQVPGFQGERRRCAHTVTCVRLDGPPDNELHLLETPCGQPFNHFPPHLQKSSCILPGSTFGYITPVSQNAGVMAAAMLTWPQRQGISMVISLWPKWWELKLDEEAAYRELVKALPRVPIVFLRQLASELQPGNPNNRALSHVRCNALGGGRAILIGDAAHAMTPAIGMGCNSALADGAALGEALEATGGDIAQLPQTWTRTRLPEVRSLVSVSEGYYWLNSPGSVRMASLGALPYVLMLLTMVLPAWVSKLPAPLKPPCTRPDFHSALHNGDSVNGALAPVKSYVLRIATIIALSMVFVFALVAKVLR